MTAGSFSVVGVVFALQFFADVPKVRTDIMQVRSTVYLQGGNLFHLSLSTRHDLEILMAARY